MLVGLKAATNSIMIQAVQYRLPIANKGGSYLKKAFHFELQKVLQSQFDTSIFHRIERTPLLEVCWRDDNEES